MPPSSGLELLDLALRIKKEVEGRESELRDLGLDVVALLSELEAASEHERTSAGYEEVKVNHDRFINQMLELTRDATGFTEQFKRGHYQSRISELLETLQDVDVSVLADDELIAVCERARENVMATPNAVAAALATVYISQFALALSHAETLSAYLDRPSLGTQILDGAGTLLKAAVLDAGGTVLPFLGTADALLQLATTQMVRDQKRMRSAMAESDRLWFFLDQMSGLVQGAEIAKGAAHVAGDAIAKANFDFDTDSRWLIRVLDAATDA